MRKKILFFIAVSIACYMGTANALQVKSAKDNETLFFKVSEKEYSRVFVTGDHIVSIKGKNNQYEIKEFKGNGDEGVLFIRPVTLYGLKPFSVFLTTEQGHHFTLFLGPMDIPAENIEIRPVSASKATAIRWEENMPYTQEMVALMRDMVAHSQPEGYAVVNLGQVKPKEVGSGLSMQLITFYKGGLLQGEIWRLYNHAGHMLFLHPREFYQNNVRAASIMNESLRNGEDTLLYRIVSHE